MIRKRDLKKEIEALRKEVDTLRSETAEEFAKVYERGFVVESGHELSQPQQEADLLGLGEDAKQPRPKAEKLEGNDWMNYVSSKVLMETLGLKHKNAWYYAAKYGIHTKKDEKGHNWYCFADVRRAKEEREAKAKK